MFWGFNYIIALWYFYAHVWLIYYIYMKWFVNLPFHFVIQHSCKCQSLLSDLI